MSKQISLSSVHEVLTAIWGSNKSKAIPQMEMRGEIKTQTGYDISFAMKMLCEASTYGFVSVEAGKVVLSENGRKFLSNQISEGEIVTRKDVRYSSLKSVAHTKGITSLPRGVRKLKKVVNAQ